MTVNDEEKDLLAGAFVDEPPLHVDLGQLVARGRRRRLVRQTGTVGGVVLGVASIAVVSVVVAGAPGGGQLPPAGPGGMSAPKTPSVSVSHGAPSAGQGNESSQGQGSSYSPGSSSGQGGSWSQKLEKGTDCDKHHFNSSTPVDAVVAPTPGDPRAQAINNTLNQAWRQADLRLPAGFSLRHGYQSHPMCVGNGGWSLAEEMVTAGGDRLLLVEIWPTATRHDCNGGQPRLGCVITQLSKTQLSDGTELRATPDGGGMAQAIRPEGVTVSVQELQAAPDQPTHPMLPVSVLTHIATLPGLAVQW